MQFYLPWIVKISKDMRNIIYLTNMFRIIGILKHSLAFWRLTRLISLKVNYHFLKYSTVLEIVWNYLSKKRTILSWLNKFVLQFAKCLPLAFKSAFSVSLLILHAFFYIHLLEFLCIFWVVSFVFKHSSWQGPLLLIVFVKGVSLNSSALVKQNIKMNIENKLKWFMDFFICTFVYRFLYLNESAFARFSFYSWLFHMFSKDNGEELFHSIILLWNLVNLSLRLDTLHCTEI